MYQAFPLSRLKDYARRSSKKYSKNRLKYISKDCRFAFGGFDWLNRRYHGKIYEKLQEVLNLKEGECTPDGKFSLESCRCVGACGLAPVMMINDDVHGRLVPDDVEKILAQYN